MPRPSRLREKLFMGDFENCANKNPDKDADAIFGNLWEGNAQKDLQHLDEKVKKARSFIENIEKIPEIVFKLIEDLYDKDEITIDRNSCEYSNGVFRAKTTKDFSHHKKSNPDYWTAINMLFTTNEVAYLIAWMEYYHLGRLDEYIDKAKNLDLFIWRTMSDFCKYSPKEDNYTIEWSILESKSFSRNNEKWVFVTIVFKLLNSKGDLCSYSEVHFYDRKWIEYRNAPKFLSTNK